MDTVTETLLAIGTLTDQLEAQIAHLKTHATEYSDAVSAARANGAPVELYSGSIGPQLANALVPRLRAASQSVRFVSGELIRLTGY
jgi:hypothetical protein